MITNDTVKWLEILAGASFLYGPFFFSLLFILVVTRSAHSYYKCTCERSTPPASPEERQTYRRYFFASVTAGMLLVFIAVGWWIYAQFQQDHTLEGVITGLPINQTIITIEDNVYLRSVERDAGSGFKMKDYHFVVIKDHPFVSGQTFRLGFFRELGTIGPQKPEPIELAIIYAGRSSEKFRVIRRSDTFALTRAE